MSLPILYLRIVLTLVVGSVALTMDSTKAQPGPSLTNAISQTDASLFAERKSIWESGVGEGFRPTTRSIGVSVGANYGIAAFGGQEAHHLAMVSLSYGHMLGHKQAESHWYRGNPEFRLELFTGGQFSPNSEWFVGLTPHLRYHFATGNRLVPFADAGIGVTATGIGPPDLSGTFEFNLQGGGGVQWFLKDNLALTMDVHYTHWSCAGIHKPNLGLNGVTGLLGLIFYF
jgi:lipid A 3-O-deacylase